MQDTDQKQVQHTQDIFSLSSFTKPDNHSLAKRSHRGGYQSRTSQCIHERIKEEVFATYDQSQTSTSLLAAARHI